MWLPIAAHEPLEVAGAATTDQAPPCLSAAGHSNLTVLAVDDDELVLRNTVNMLKGLGYRVITVDSGQKALALIVDGVSVDLIVSDQGMPHMTGVELAGAVKSRRLALQTLIITGYADLPPRTDPALRRLAKPFTQRELAEALDRTFAST
ncbi:MAG: response regulator [Terracidiphilus sp.]